MRPLSSQRLRYREDGLKVHQLGHLDVMRHEMNVLFGNLDYQPNDTKGSAIYFDPVLLSRMQFAWVIAWHNHAMATMVTFIQTRDPSVFIPPL